MYNLNYGKRRKSHGTRLGEYEECWNAENLFLW